MTFLQHRKCVFFKKVLNAYVWVSRRVAEWVKGVFRKNLQIAFFKINEHKNI